MSLDRLTFASWALGIRIWAAAMGALYAAFWLQLQSASSAVVCVGILALPTRGQAFEKALYRLVATMVGAVASIVIASIFNEVRDLFIVAFAGWLALCVFAANMLDGNQAYGVVLSGYTVAIVAVANADTPQDVFTSAVNRCAAIIIGILAIALVNDLFAAPDVYPDLLARLREAHRKTRELTWTAILLGEIRSVDVAGLLKEITSTHVDIIAVSLESVAGRARSSAARTASLAMIRQLAALRAVVTTKAGLVAVDGELPAELAATFVDGAAVKSQALRSHLLAIASTCAVTDRRFVALSAAVVLLDQDLLTEEALGHLKTGNGQTHGPRLRIYRSRRAAGRNALRVFLALLISSCLLVLAGWPSTSFALTLLGSTASLSSTNPSPRGFATSALIGIPLAAISAGITQFLILDGVDQFPLLCIAMAPTMIVACLLLTSGNPLLMGIGFINLVFFPILLSPSNPQSYNPQTYLYNSVMATTAVIALFVFLSTLLPTDDLRRRRWIFKSAEAERRGAATERSARYDEATEAYRDADRIGQLGELHAKNETEREADLRRILCLADLSSAARRIVSLLKHCRTTRRAGSDLAEVAAALAAIDPARLRSVADELIATSVRRSSQYPTAARRAAAELIATATLIELRSGEVSTLRTGIA